MKKFFVFVVLMLIAMMFTACVPYDKPEIVTIEPSQTAFLIPLDGKTSTQASFMSEEFLKQALVATKQVQIPHRWVQDGRMQSNGHYIPTMRLIIVERKPETREWTESEKDGTSVKNEGITAESKESTGFMARMNASAQIDEADAIRFLYRYNNKPLAEVMDTEIRARVESKFVEECAKYGLEEILANKAKIMQAVRDDVIPYFKERGVTITVVGLKGEFTYLNPEIQKSIDEKFKSAQAVITQKNLNDQSISKAEAEAQAKLIEAEGIANANRKVAESLSDLILKNKWLDKWNGVQPLFQGGQMPNFNIPLDSVNP